VALEEHVVVTRVVTNARLYATYRACMGFWDGQTCDKSQPRSVVSDCSLAGTSERIEEHDARTTRTPTKPCEPPDPDGSECLVLGGVKYWHMASGDDPAGWVTEQQGIVYDAIAHRWHRAPTP
jgi:hypothetical protein